MSSVALVKLCQVSEDNLNDVIRVIWAKRPQNLLLTVSLKFKPGLCSWKDKWSYKNMLLNFMMENGEFCVFFFYYFTLGLCCSYINH